MAGYETFMLGPLGYMRDLPSPSARSGVDLSLLKYGGIFEAATGRRSIDVLGQTRIWAFNWPYINKAQENVLRAFWSVSPTQDYRLIDPFIDNQLTPDASSGGSVSKSSTHFSMTAGTSLTTVPISTPALAANYLPYITHAQQWVVPASTSGVLYADDTAFYRTPIRDTRPLYLTWLATGSGTVHATIKPYNQAGSSLTVQTGSGVALDGTWKPITYTYTPLASHYSFATGLTLDSSAGIKTILVTAGQVNDAASLAWSLGEGIGPVIIPPDGFSSHYKHYSRLYEVKFEIDEAA